MNLAETGSRLDYPTFLASSNKVRYITDSGQEQDGIGTTYHECGTLWMGDDPASSVTDVHGRFHHLANAACADQSLFPTSDSANPVPTGLSLARKVARGIAKRYATAPPPTLEPGFRFLFDGTLGNWAMVDEANFFPFQTPAGPVLGAGLDNLNPALGVVWHAGQFRDFDLRIQFRTFSPLANGGVFLRAPQPSGNLFAPGGFYERALEVQIDERGFDPATNAFGSPRHRTGAVYGRLPANRWAACAPNPRDRDEERWNDLQIVLRGALIEVVLNRELVCAGSLSPILATGHIGLQCHTEVVQYRAIRVRDL